MSTTVIFRVRLPPSAWGSNICITGSDSYLTEWGLGHPLSFSPPFYTISITLPSNLYFEYKYISVIDGCIQAWEQLLHGKNRHIQTPPPGYTLLLDDGVVGDDSNVRTTLTPPKQKAIPQQPVKQPISAEEAELALQLQRTSAHIDALRHSVRTLKGLPPTNELSGTDVSADYCTDINTLIQRCLDDGHALVTMLRSVKNKPREGTGRGSILVALAFAVFTVVVAVLVISPQMAREVCRVSTMVFMGIQGVGEGVWKRGWKGVCGSIRSAAVEVGEKVRERIYETVKLSQCFEGKGGVGKRIWGMVGEWAGRLVGQR